MTTKERILLESKAWRQEKLSLEPEYFVRLNNMHQPKILWISSTDNLVSIREMTNTDPGDIIVYRNLGTQVRLDDPSLMAVVEDAVEVHGVSHIIICGYSHCTAIGDVLRGTDKLRPQMQNWLSNLRGLYERNLDELAGLPFEGQEKLLSELNIREQVKNLASFPSIQKAWEKADSPHIYGWYFDLHQGLLREVFSLERNHRMKQHTTLRGDAPAIKVTAS
jgi:carbonic anhydrase